MYLKDTVADAATRTFNVTLLVRNRRIEVGLPDEYADKNLARTRDLYGFESEKADGEPPFYVDESAIHTDADGQTFVWKVDGLRHQDLTGEYDPVFTVSAVKVEMGDNVLPILQIFRGREITDLGGLDPHEDLVTGQLPPSTQEGDSVFLSRSEWLLRPGQLVHVEMKGESVAAGYYVPRPAILREGGKHYVFLAADSTAGGEQARRVEVNVHELLGDFRRISAIDASQLHPGGKLILDGAHYLQDGDSVNAFEEIEVSL